MKQILLITLLGFHLLASSASYAVCNPNIIKNKPNSLYIENGDGTVTDTKTRLIWQKCSLGQTYTVGTCTGTATAVTWAAALAAANADTQYGYSDWRVPNKNELASLVEGACYLPSINEFMFPATVSRSSFYWSASVAYGGAWVVHFGNGGVDRAGYNIYVNVDGYDESNFNYVRLVRGGQ